MRAEGGSAAASAPAVVGRRAELDLAASALRALERGSGALLTFVGEPGIGKTHLAEAVAAQAGDHGLRVAWGRGWEGGGAPAYWPWIQALRALVADAEVDELRAALGDGAGGLAYLVDDIPRRLPEVTPTPLGHAEEARFALFDAVAQFLAALAARRPVVLVLDDLHVADEPSWHLLDFLARGLVTMPVLVVGTYRDADLKGRAALATIAGRLARVERRQALRGLDEDEVGELVLSRLGRAAAPDLVDAVAERTAGNPFFVDEVVRFLVAEGAFEADATIDPRTPLPGGVRETIRGRLDGVAPDVVDLLRTASAIGREFRLSTLAAAADRDPAAVLEALDRAAASGMVAAVPDSAEQHRFVHDLVRDTLYRDASLLDRAERHRAVAAALEARYAGDLDPHHAELAHHYGRALPLVGPEPAVRHHEAAGRRAARQQAHEQAAVHFRHALDALPPTVDGAARRVRLTVALGRVLQRAGDDDGARAVLLDACAQAARHGLVEGQARAALALGTQTLSPGTVDDEAVAQLEAVLARLGDPAHRTLRAVVLARLAAMTYWGPDDDRRLRLADEAEAIADGIDDDPHTRTAVYEQLLLARAGLEDETRRREVQRLIDVSRDDPTGDAHVQALSWRFHQRLHDADLAGAHAELHHFERVAERTGQPRWRIYVPFKRALLAVAEGRFTEAEDQLTTAGALAARVGASWAPIILPAQWAALRWWQGRAVELLEPIGQVAADVPAMSSWRAYHAVALCDAGRTEEARDVLRRLLQGGGPRRDLLWLLATSLAAEVAFRVGDAEAGAVLHERLTPHRDALATITDAALMAPVARFRALAAAAAGDHDDAALELVMARKLAERTGMRAAVALCDLDAAALAQARGENPAALLAVAAPRAEELGMGARVPRHAAGGDEAGSAIHRPAPPDPRTATLRRDGEVWTIARGDEIARLRDSRGLRFLAALLQRPATDVHALELSAEGAADVVRAAADEAAGPLLDQTARDAYRARLADLEEDVEEADRFGDHERAAHAREERAALAEQLAQAFGLGGRDRPVASDAERARVNVTRALRTTARRIADHAPVLGAELDRAVRTGTFCRYEPDPRNPVTWEVDTGA